MRKIPQHLSSSEQLDKLVERMRKLFLDVKIRYNSIGRTTLLGASIELWVKTNLGDMCIAVLNLYFTDDTQRWWIHNVSHIPESLSKLLGSYMEDLGNPYSDSHTTLAGV